MEEKNDIGLKHLAHEHLLILNENYIGKVGDDCRGCKEQIDSCQSSVYSCSDDISRTYVYDCDRFLLHKACAELPPKILSPIDQNEFLFFQPPKSRSTCCIICGLWSSWKFTYCSSFNTDIYVCFKCAVFQVQQSKEDPIFVYPGHSHPLAIIEEPSKGGIFSSNEDETYPNLVHLPAADELSLNLLLEQFIKDKITLSDTSYKSNSISSSTKDIKHWSHEEHVLKLITFNELFDRENDDKMLLLRCNGCYKPIRTDDSLFYGCVPCKYCYFVVYDDQAYSTTLDIVLCNEVKHRIR
ncbi:hypothetical protein POM88_043318 [Heracleum sosnowskyi]|uniref:DC1 domain-containing protein n=1 Tax=Heracleum sosnowskyi TaxID=360622 RepID=A0AAD8H355_9APIA|nr:hypothetical protein POM88_043318 [Heracleum sosnowskyi]